MFEASNGVEVLEITPDAGLYLDGTPFYIRPDQKVALEEYFQAKRDKELGRWRWPENPDYFVVPRDKKVRGRRVVRVFQESRGRVNDFFEDDSRIEETHATARAARDYFSAHPEPKPWLGARPGEVWVFTWALGSKQPALILNNGKFVLRDNDSSEKEYSLDEPAIEAGHRIWPEGETND